MNPPLVGVDQNILQQNKGVSSIQNRALSYFSFVKITVNLVCIIKISTSGYNKVSMIFLKTEAILVRVKRRHVSEARKMKNKKGLTQQTGRWWKAILYILPCFYKRMHVWEK